MATLASGQCLQPGQSLQSDNQLYTLTLQTDGNVVLYNQQSQPLWATNTGGLIAPRDFAMQPDGNLVLYDMNGVPRWASNTDEQPGAFLSIQGDGNLVVYRLGTQTATAENALWAAGSTQYGFPWFALYDEAKESLPTAAPLSQLKTIREQEVEQDMGDQEIDESIDIAETQIKKLHPPDWETKNLYLTHLQSAVILRLN